MMLSKEMDKVKRRVQNQQETAQRAQELRELAAKAGHVQMERAYNNAYVRAMIALDESKKVLEQLEKVISGGVQKELVPSGDASGKKR